VAVRHFDKAKAFGTAGVTVSNEIDLVHSTIRLKELVEVLIGGSIRKIADKNIHGTSFDLKRHGNDRQVIRPVRRSEVQAQYMRKKWREKAWGITRKSLCPQSENI
jgi:hypothetical protein